MVAARIPERNNAKEHPQCPIRCRPPILVIVESPAKAKTIQGYLGPGFDVDSSVGHIRDLPNSAAEIPAKFKGLPWARMAIDVDHDFTPIYVVHPSKKAKVAELKKKLESADELLLATDEDREGEAIAWHLLEVPRRRFPSSAWCSTRSPRRPFSARPTRRENLIGHC